MTNSIPSVAPVDFTMFSPLFKLNINTLILSRCLTDLLFDIFSKNSPSRENFLIHKLERKIPMKVKEEEQFAEKVV